MSSSSDLFHWQSLIWIKHSAMNYICAFRLHDVGRGTWVSHEGFPVIVPGIDNPKTRKFSTLLTKTGCSHSGFTGVFDDALCSHIAYACLYVNSRHNTVTNLDYRTPTPRRTKFHMSTDVLIDDKLDLPKNSVYESKGSALGPSSMHWLDSHWRIIPVCYAVAIAHESTKS